MKTFVTFLLALLAHVFLGWAWTWGAAVVGGLWAGKKGWLVGGIGVGLGWLALLGYSAVVSFAPTQALAGILGGLLGGIPGTVAYLLVFVIGFLIGLFGGAVGQQLRALFGGPSIQTGWAS